MTDKLDKVPGAADTPPAGAVPHETIKAIPVRHYGRWVSAVVVLALVAAIVYAFGQSDNVRWATVPDKLFDSTIIRGLFNTIWISVASMALGLVLGVLFAVMRLSKNPVTSTIAWVYIWLFRGTPVYVQLLIWFNLALIFPILNLGFYKDEMTQVMTPFLAALLGLGLNEGAYMAEIVRAGIQSVDEGQTEASHALGMTQTQTMRRVVLPQAMRVIVPPTGNEFINMLKTSSLVVAVQYFDLLRAAQDIASTSFAVMEMFFVASIWYLALTSVFSVGQYYLERHYARGSLRSLPPTPWQKIKANLSRFSTRKAVA